LEGTNACTFLLYRCVQMNECSSGQEVPAKKTTGPRTVGIRSGNEDAENSVCEPKPETNPRHSDPKSIIPFGKSVISVHQNIYFLDSFMTNSNQ
jgi:hypothetical protein